MTRCPPGSELSLPDGPDARMEESFQPPSRFGVRKYTPGQFIAAQPAVGPDNFFAEHPLQFRERGLSRFNDLPRDVVGIDQGKTAFAQQIGRRRFAHADSPGKSECFHADQSDASDASSQSSLQLRERPWPGPINNRPDYCCFAR